MNKIYYSTQTQKALQNFPFSTSKTNLELIYSIAKIKKAAAIANYKTGKLDKKISDAIIQAVNSILTGKFDSQFPLPSLQGGAGTSINMNVNEVIASYATDLLKNKPIVHSNDHVNMSQSTNDVNPSALKITCLIYGQKLLITLNNSVKVLKGKAREFRHIHKLGRTHLQDAVPITMGSEFDAYAYTIDRGIKRLNNSLKQCYELNLGGTAVGNCINSSKKYRKVVYKELSRITGFDLKMAKNLMAQTSSQSDFLSISQALVALTLDFSKMANDLRLMASGPVGGIGEIQLQELQSGSSIMPGKINPVLPEVVNQLYFMVSGNNLTIEQAAHASFLELANMLPILADRLLSSFILTEEVIRQFTNKCLKTIVANKKRCNDLLERSTAYSTLFTPVLGYDVVNELVKESISKGKEFKKIVIEKKFLTETEFNLIVKKSIGI